MEVFITGIAGALGRRLAKMLVKLGYKVRGNDCCAKISYMKYFMFCLSVLSMTIMPPPPLV